MDTFLLLACIYQAFIFAAGDSTCKQLESLPATDDTQYLQSHGLYGVKDYDNNAHSCWIIEAEADHVVMLNFTHLSIKGSCESSSTDWIFIFDGPSENSEILDKVCGDYVPPPLYSSQQTVYIQFLTDISGTAGGFKLAYKSVEQTSYDEDGPSENRDGGLIAAIVFGCIFGLAIIVGVTACCIACIVVIWNEKKTAGSRGIVHSLANGHTVHPAAGVCDGEAATGSDTKSLPKGEAVVEVTPQGDAPPVYSP